MLCFTRVLTGTHILKYTNVQDPLKLYVPPTTRENITYTPEHGNRSQTTALYHMIELVLTIFPHNFPQYQYQLQQIENAIISLLFLKTPAKQIISLNEQLHAQISRHHPCFASIVCQIKQYLSYYLIYLSVLLSYPLNFSRLSLKLSSQSLCPSSVLLPYSAQTIGFAAGVTHGFDTLEAV